MSFSQVTKMIGHNFFIIACFNYRKQLSASAVQLQLDIDLFNKVNGFLIESFSPPEKLEVEIVCVAQ